MLKVDIPSLLDEKMPGMRHVVCANLPYNVTGPVISKLLEIGCFDSVTVMIQREVARRICAEPGTGDYGAFTAVSYTHLDVYKRQPQGKTHV